MSWLVLQGGCRVEGSPLIGLLPDHATREQACECVKDKGNESGKPRTRPATKLAIAPVICGTVDGERESESRNDG